MATRTEMQLQAAVEERERHAKAAKSIIDTADAEDRDRTEKEDKQVAEHVKAIEVCNEKKAELDAKLKTEKEIEDVGRAVGQRPEQTKALDRVQVIEERKSLGEMFVESEAFKSIKKGTHFSTGQVELSAKGTLLTGTGAPGTGTGGGLLPVPDVVPGVVSKLFQPLTVADIIPSGQTSTNTLRYVVEGTATNAAAGVAEAGAKPESTLALSTVDEPVKKIATTLTISDEMLEDAAAVQSYINSRLSFFIRQEEEDEIVLGGGGNDLTGITGRSGVNTYGIGTVDNNAVGLFKALNGTRGSSFLEPDYIIMNPANWQNTRLLVDSNGQFFGGGPFQGPYGAGRVDPASGQLTGATDTIWNKPVIVTTAIGAGTALIGAFGAASQIFRRSGLTIEATNSHSDYFTKNLVALRAELRLALCVYRPAAFTKVTGLNG